MMDMPTYDLKLEQLPGIWRSKYKEELMTMRERIYKYKYTGKVSLTMVREAFLRWSFSWLDWVTVFSALENIQGMAPTTTNISGKCVAKFLIYSYIFIMTNVLELKW